MSAVERTDAAQPHPAPLVPREAQVARTATKREATWTLVQLSGRLTTWALPNGRLVKTWSGQWVALNQAGEVWLYGSWADCFETAKYWLERQPPRGAADGEGGAGWRGPLPGGGQ